MHLSTIGQETFLHIKVCKWFTFVEHKLEESGRPGDIPLRKAAAVAIVKNPFAGRYVEDLSEAIAASEALGTTLAKHLLDAFGSYEVQSYGKGGIVGIDGEQEHANALLTTTFAEPLRKALGGGKAWIPSVTKVGAPGVAIDIPLACKEALYVRSHYDAMTLAIPDGPLPDEIAVIFAVANRGRLNARVGGLKFEERRGEDGLV